MKTCPKCDSTELGDRWCNGRKLQYYCQECNWSDTPRIPEQQSLPRHRELRVDDFCGWDYHVYDKYGHIAIMSQTYGNRQKALEAMGRDLRKGEKNEEAGPSTALLYYVPPVMMIEGEKFTCKDGQVSKKERL